MIPALLELPPLPTVASARELHVLVVARHADPRFLIADMLLEAGLCVTAAATFGVVELLIGSGEAFDMMIVAQSSEETAAFGVPQLARSVDAELPILVVEFETANSPAVVEMVHSASLRWPLRERSSRSVH